MPLLLSGVYRDGMSLKFDDILSSIYSLLCQIFIKLLICIGFPL